MRLKLASRKSDLARWQAVQVGRALEQLPEKPGIEFIFKSSLGDQNLDIPLASMGAKGVFTEDFYNDLVSGQCDLVVHSWKDLPVDERVDTHIAMTLARADVRDVMVVPEVVWQKAVSSGRLEVLTSSPRRVYNLRSALPQLLPAGVTVEFVTVRGNVPTRLQKMHDEGRALVLAKAGLDRLLQAESEGFLTQGTGIRSFLRDCRFQVLPVSLNPPAPAQGALAIEVSRENEAMNQMCQQLSDHTTFACVNREREILKRYGGGCHQKIGVAVVVRPYGTIHALRGLTDGGEVLYDWRIENLTSWPRSANETNVFPLQAKDNSWFVRKPAATLPELSDKPALFIARADALPPGYIPSPRQTVWTAGVQTWAKLARQGVWVSGCQDGLGENEPFGLDYLAGQLKWTKLTHGLAAGPEALATYRLEPKKEVPDLRGKTHFFWMSTTSFQRAYELFPNEIANGYNACGPGVTYEFLQRQTALKNPVKVFIGLEQFLSETLP
ncbi:MAG: hydroxymethylbilane synthase [Bdellovibrionales bacterium]|nr:hydroxymethylbilane synthase [Bdellovibrionales bacterium]